jgi:alpha-glucosidase
MKLCVISTISLSFCSSLTDFGYDISDYESIQPEYGTMEDFDELIAKANELGRRTRN